MSVEAVLCDAAAPMVQGDCFASMIRHTRTESLAKAVDYRESGGALPDRGELGLERIAAAVGSKTCVAWDEEAMLGGAAITEVENC